MGVQWIEGDGEDVIVADDTHFPVVVTTWMGAPTERAVRGYFVWLHELLARALREGTPLINVTDSGLAGLPSGDVRRLIAELTAKFEAAGADPHAVSAFVVVESAVMRGVLRALAWLHGGMKATQVATCQEALEAGLAVLAKARRPAPPTLVPSRWRRPARWSRSA